ncbi:Phosphatidylinositol 4-kinase LSB6 [Extremus antarcticus]|uniref:Phosphatidylinositol 4-kinase n=1 Tax=Extremus antarcticus TaxID=702011 RepID=A0AAJ0GGB9_9PEZI|nr:Phosphatidylinositol 4-kinase LSB6 [Extremus antarcticus]
MPRRRPQVSGYARIAQAEEEEEEQQHPYSDSDRDDNDPFQDPPTVSAPGTEYAPIQPKRRDFMRVPSSSTIGGTRRPRRRRTNSGVDIKAINARLERWAEEIKERFKIKRIKGKSAREEMLEIHHSVFVPPEGMRPAVRQSLENGYDDSEQRLGKVEFDDMVESVRTAIELGMHPQLISQGSSGSYFVRNSGGKVLGVFKPKDEEPYASKNPKWTKWIHRNLFPFFFGRACLIPNLSYVSEAAAYVLDVQLRTNIVPYTEVVSLSSKSFFYDFWDRRQFRRGKKVLPEKQGSFQVFLKGFKGATEFFREHPWPDQQNGGFRDAPDHKRRKRKRWDQSCRPGSAPGGAPGAEEGDTEDEEAGRLMRDGSRGRQEFWSEKLQQSFREELEKLVILDYIMRNTDRGTDNWMIRIDTTKDEATIVKDYKNKPQPDDGTAEAYHRRNESMTAAVPDDENVRLPHLGAIDNSLSWPWKHPDAWRSYPFGWLFLPVSLIGRPFSQKTRDHFLPLLTSKDWWSETQIKLRRTFEIDADFKDRMFARQMAVMKGQAWNVVETLKTPDHGPLELTRRQRVCVWDDLVDIPVAVPLTRPSEEMRRATNEGQQRPRRTGGIAEEEEMDISAAYAPAVPSKLDLLGMTSPPGKTSENPFNHSRQNSAQDIHVEPTSPVMTKEIDLAAMHSASAPRPAAYRSNTAGRASLDTPRSLHRSPSERRRRFSFAVGRGFGTRTAGWGDHGDEEDGDLGYAAANDQQNITRKVIVERLEMVKSRPPVFTWC